MPVADVRGQRLHYEDTGGPGPAVVLSHGFFMDATMFDAQVAALAPTHRCVTWDQRGFGGTDVTGPFTLWDAADDLLGLLDHLGIGDAVLVGMSQGGYVALRAALVAPARVRALVLIDSQARADSSEEQAGYRALFATWTGDGPLDEVAATVAGMIIGDPEVAAPWVAKWTAAPRDRIRHPAEALVGRDDVTDRLGEITCPVLVVHGTEDVAIPLATAEATCRALPDCRGMVAVEGAAHAPNLTHPAEVDAALLAFLAEVDGRP